MSADNWAVCPRCKARLRVEMETERARVDAAYGVLPVDEFDAMRAAFIARAKAEPPTTFREDYEFWGVEDGVLRIDYGGECQVCGLTFTHRSEHPIPLDDD